MSSPQTYPTAVEELRAWEVYCPLGPGQPNLAARERLAGLTPVTLVSPHHLRDEELARACLAGLWLRHNFLDESHTISQDIGNPSGSYWHAILHRREPDAWNSKYWFRRVGNHPVLAQLAEAAARLGWRTWDPVAFVDACEKERGTGSERETLLCEVQQTEWELLFAWCYEQAKG